MSNKACPELVVWSLYDLTEETKKKKKRLTAVYSVVICAVHLVCLFSGISACLCHCSTSSLVMASFCELVTQLWRLSPKHFLTHILRFELNIQLPSLHQLWRISSMITKHTSQLPCFWCQTIKWRPLWSKRAALQKPPAAPATKNW